MSKGERDSLPPHLHSGPGRPIATHMRSLQRVLGMLLVGAGVGACAKPDVDAYVTGMERMSRVIESNDASCEKMGRALLKFMDSAHGQAVKDWSNHYTRLNSRERKAVEQQRYKDRLHRATEAMMPAFERCHTHATVKAAFETI